MTNKNWQTILMYPHHLNEKERERRMGKAGVEYTSFHETEAKAKAAAEEMLRELKQVDDTEWTACYAEGRSEFSNRSAGAKCIRTSELDG